MALKTYVDNGKAIAYHNDHEPCKAYKDGELLTDISYTTQSVTGKSSVTYESEYKKNLLSMEIQGKTEQTTSRNLLNEALLSQPILGSAEYITDETGSYWSMAPTSIYTGEIIDSLKSRLVVGHQLAVLAVNNSTAFNIRFIDESSNILTFVSVGAGAGDYYIKSSAIITNEILSNLYAIVFLTSSTTPISFENLAIYTMADVPDDSVPSYEPYRYPGIETPVPIQNTGDNGLEVEIKSPNLFDLQHALNTDNWIYVGGAWSLALNLEVGKEYTISVDKIKSVVGVLCLCRKDDMSKWAYETVIRFEPENVGNKFISFKADGRECLWIYRNSPAANAELITELFTSGVRVMLLDGIY
ncbi:MAG: hypothetical protein J6A95_00820, partial [Clostridia bacterium]|nr:hypothetical protein [Clostridia bacterium]